MTTRYLYTIRAELEPIDLTVELTEQEFAAAVSGDPVPVVEQQIERELEDGWARPRWRDWALTGECRRIIDSGDAA